MNNNPIHKPGWLKINLGNNKRFSETGSLISSQNLHTICQSGRCPNLGECWNRGSATFMICGDVCTRSCKFCNTKTGRPSQLDAGEPLRIALSIKQLKLNHAVITSVDRDDLTDFGALHWAETVKQIHLHNPDTTIETLVPDFMGNVDSLNLVVEAHPDIISHNMETVHRLTPAVRSAARYERSLSVLKNITQSDIPAKTGLMLGMGETEDEVIELMNDVLSAGCRLMSIGQYLQPSRNHFPVVEYVHPDIFTKYREKALSLGFRHVESGPLVRSSYHSENFLQSNV
ncbi:MAG: lipoyl synthase [Dysgonamonadaceae bacterium]|jgi:lipoic acid synthetase|nr:lipoyl synthase [Dysgonamonadaceae bacterium]